MIPPGTKYRIVGVHEEDSEAPNKEELHGAIVDAVDLKRWRKTALRTNYWCGTVRFLEAAGRFKKNERFFFYAIYLRQVQEEGEVT